MKLVRTEEQVTLQDAFRDLFTNECPTELVRRFQDDPQMATIDRLWTSLARTGFFGLPLPEDLGGEGAEFFDLALAVMEAGRVLCPTPVYSTAAFGFAVRELGSPDQQQALLPSLARGEVVATVAISCPSDASDVRPRLRATRTDGIWLIDGTLEFVANADVADQLLVSATVGGHGEPDRTLCFVVDPRTTHVERMRTMSRDSQCVVSFDGVRVDDPIRVIGDESDRGISDSELARVANALSALQMMEMIGGAQAVLDRTVEYLKTRDQFNRPLAGFQAVQHHVANMHIAIECARLATYQAAWWVSRGATAEREVAIAKLKCNEAYKTASLTAHQLHGGMGYMREFDLHLWSERAKTTELLGGGKAATVRRLERSLGMVR